MKISQRVYFDISSETMPAADVTARLGAEPDRLQVRGSRRTQPPVPALHSWSVQCQEREMALDAQIGTVLARIEPIHQRLLDLAASSTVALRLVIVRYFDDPDGDEERFDAVVTGDGKLLERLPGQHQLLGWSLTCEQLSFLASIRCSIWADGYG